MSHNAAPILILTRPAAASARFRRQLGPVLDGIEVIESPVLEIVDLSPAISPHDYKGLILTSEQGAAAAARLGIPPLPFWAVGERTAEVAARLGYRPVGVEPDAARLIPRMLAERPEAPLLHVRGVHARVAIAARLTEAGISADEVVAYDQREQQMSAAALAALAGARPVILPVFSPRSAKIIARQRTLTAPLHVVAISKAAADAFSAYDPVNMIVAEAPDAAAMAVATAAAIAHLRGQGPTG